MKYIYLLILATTFISCSENIPDKNTKLTKSDTVPLDSVVSTSIAHTEFPHYKLTIRDTIKNTWDFGGSTEKINLGNYVTDSSIIKVITEFNLIPVADGLRGKSKLYLITNLLDTLIYEPDTRTSLPIDIYLNHFVFKNEMDQYIFVKAEIINEEVLCFGNGWNECLIK